MTDALRKAAEALRLSDDLLERGVDGAVFTSLFSVREANATALAAIEAELSRVPEDRVARMRADAMSATIAEVDATDALKLIAEALRQARQWMLDWAPAEAYEPGENHTHTMATQEWLDKALAAIPADV